MNSIDKIDELRRVCGLADEYPVVFVKGLKDRDGIPIGGRATALGGVELDAEFESHRKFPAVYLHEVAHVVTFRAGLFDAPDAERCPHSRYFAVLLSVLYRRAGFLSYLQVYDFSDSPENWNARGPLPDDSLIVRRFAWIIRRSAQLATLRLSIEQIAAIVYREDFEPTWLNLSEPPRNASRWYLLGLA